MHCHICFWEESKEVSRSEERQFKEEPPFGEVGKVGEVNSVALLGYSIDCRPLGHRDYCITCCAETIKEGRSSIKSVSRK